jgi:hypothetical protein
MIMSKSRIGLVLPFLVVASLGIGAHAGQDPKAIGTDPAVSPAEIGTLVEGAARAVEERYVFPDVGAKIAGKLRHQQSEGNYNSLKTATALTAALTVDLQSFNQDKHLRLIPNESLPAGSGDHQSDPTLGSDGETYDNHGFVKVERLAGNIGYIKARMFYGVAPSRATVTAAMEFVADTDALIIDIRDHHGGDPMTVAFLISYLTAPERIHLNDFLDRDSQLRGSSYTETQVSGRRYGTSKPIYILINSKTFSAAEEFAYDLQALKRATLVGESTGGGANPGGFIRLSDRFSVFVPTGRAQNPLTGTNWEGAGVQPDLKVGSEEALAFVHRLLLQKMDVTTKPPAARREIEQTLQSIK